MNTLVSIGRSGTLIAIIANGMVGISLVWGKVLLKNSGTKNLLSYVSWLGSLSIFALILIPCGYSSEPEPCKPGILPIFFSANEPRRVPRA